MGNGCTYWMIYLPDKAPSTFLLFVADPHGNTSLRDYSMAWMRRLPSASTVREMGLQTDYGKTRFEITEIRRKEDVPYWQNMTRQFNERYLSAPPGLASTPKPSIPATVSTVHSRRRNNGRATRGSQRQLQDYVNLFQPELNKAILDNMPEALQSAPIRWLSPLADEDYREYQDEEFLERVGLSEFKSSLAEFWPQNGPCWDGLALLGPLSARAYPAILLVESKSHVPEMRSNGCQASEISLAKIRRSLEEARRWCRAEPRANWTGPLYQSANRIAHLYFIRNRLNRPSYLVNVYFVDDPYRPTSQDEWEKALKAAHEELGLTVPVPGLIEVLLPAKPLQIPEERLIVAAKLDETNDKIVIATYEYEPSYVLFNVDDEASKNLLAQYKQDQPTVDAPVLVDAALPPW